MAHPEILGKGAHDQTHVLVHRVEMPYSLRRDATIADLIDS
jgi:hypothetical protein